MEISRRNVIMLYVEFVLFLVSIAALSAAMEKAKRELLKK